MSSDEDDLFGENEDEDMVSSLWFRKGGPPTWVLSTGGCQE